MRNLAAVTLTPSSHINLLYGANGSGKTSLLEAIHLLGLARSFRSSKIKPIIQQDQARCAVFGAIDHGGREIPIGVQRDLEGGHLIKRDGHPVQAVAELATLLPLQIINPDSFRLLEGGPKERRQFLDWGVFHVKPQFLPVWKRAQRCLKQRNSLLRHGRIDRLQLRIWDRELVESAHELDRMREAYMALLLPRFEEALAALTELPELKVSYYRGWERSTPLDQLLEQGLDRDIQSGYTHVGPQRADLRVRTGRQNAAERLSRGQQKLVVCALKIAQGFVYQDQQRSRCVYLVDDLPSELDQQHRKALCSLLERMDCQVFITSVDKESMVDCWSAAVDLKLFHVEQGTVTEEPIAQPQE